MVDDRVAKGTRIRRLRGVVIAFATVSALLAVAPPAFAGTFISGGAAAATGVCLSGRLSTSNMTSALADQNLPHTPTPGLFVNYTIPPAQG